MLQVLWQRQVGKLPLVVTVPELHIWCWVNPEEANIVMWQHFLSHDFFFCWGGGSGDCISKNSKTGPRNMTCLWLLIFLGKLFFKSFCSSYVSVCPRCFLIYIQHVEICFSPDCGNRILRCYSGFIIPSPPAFMLRVIPGTVNWIFSLSWLGYVKWHNWLSEKEIIRIGLEIL